MSMPTGDRIVASFAREGYECVAARNVGLADNYSFSQIPLDAIAAMLRDVAKAKPQAIVTFCTNFPAAPIVARDGARARHPDLRHGDDGRVGGACGEPASIHAPGRDWGRVFAR